MGIFLNDEKGIFMSSKGQITGLFSPFLEKERISRIVQEISGKKILDYGCGSGKILEYLTDVKYVGVDKNIEVINEAKKIHKNKNDVIFYSLAEFHNNLEHFDTIILSAVIEHFEDPIFELNNLKRMLKSGGKIIITTPTPLGNMILKTGSFFHLFSKEAIDEHNVIFSKKDFLKMSEKINMRIEKYIGFEFGLNQLVVIIEK